MLRRLYVLLGLFFVALAGLGAVLPILPTTPFLLVASACFLRSSPALNQRLLRSRLFGPLLRDWQRHRGVRLHVKITAVVLLVAVASVSVIFGGLPPLLLILFISLVLIGLFVVLRLPMVHVESIPLLETADGAQLQQTAGDPDLAAGQNDRAANDSAQLS